MPCSLYAILIAARCNIVYVYYCRRQLLQMSPYHMFSIDVARPLPVCAPISPSQNNVITLPLEVISHSLLL